MAKQLNNSTKQMPKKTAIIRNLLDREDNLSLAVMETKNGDIKIYWDSNEEIHKKAKKELLDLLSRDELYAFVENICEVLVKPFSINSFKFETGYPSRSFKSGQGPLNIPPHKKRNN